MRDYLASIERLRTDAAEAALIRDPDLPNATCSIGSIVT
jgi:hypothetical protein